MAAPLPGYAGTPPCGGEKQNPTRLRRYFPSGGEETGPYEQPAG